MDDVRQLAGQLEHAPAARRDQHANVRSRTDEVQPRATDSHHLAVEGGLVAAPHASADLDALAHRIQRVRTRLAPEGRLLDATANTHDGASVRQLVHCGQRDRGQARVADVWVGNQALDFQSIGGLQTGGHDHETVLVETPVAHSETIEAGRFGALGKLNQPPGWFSPTNRRQIAEGELHPAATACARFTRSIASRMPRTVSA